MTAFIEVTVSASIKALSIPRLQISSILFGAVQIVFSIYGLSKVNPTDQEQHHCCNTHTTISRPADLLTPHDHIHAAAYACWGGFRGLLRS